MVPQTVNPTPVAGIGQIYDKTITSVTSDTALFFETGNGIVTQMTMNFSPVATDSGRTFLPGGILVQWGGVFGALASGNTADVTFPLAFPNACFRVFTSLGYSANPGNSGTVATKDISTTKFTWRFISASDLKYNLISWLAIGN
jgi:hypothetical protein